MPQWGLSHGAELAQEGTGEVLLFPLRLCRPWTERMRREEVRESESKSICTERGKEGGRERGR